MHIYNDTLFLATSGGLLVNDINNTSLPGLEFTNVDGLGTVDITDIIIDSAGQKWVTGTGRLTKFNYYNSTPYLFFDQDNELIKLHTAVDDGNSLWVGTEIGLVLFSKVNDGGQIEDSYTLFDSLNPSPQVYDILLDDDTIWVGTSSGIAYADKSNPLLLKSPAFWKTYDLSRYNELRSDTVNRIVEFENSFYFATMKGLYRMQRNPVDSFINMFAGAGLADSSAFTEMKVDNDTLFFYSTQATGFIKDSTINSLSTFGLPSRPSTGANTGTFRWLSVRNRDLYENSSGSYQVYEHTGLPGNVVTDITVNKSGIITAGFFDRGAGRFDNSSWTVYPLGEITTRATLDPSGDAWVGTFGNGLFRIGDGFITNYDENGTTMRGNNDPGGTSYVVIYGVKAVKGFLYVACYRALNNFPVAIGDLNNLNSMTGWDSLGLTQGINNEFVSSIDVDGPRVAIGTEGVGLFECFTGPDPSNTADDFCVNINTGNSFIAADVIRTVKYSPVGELWVGTNFGLSRYDFGIERYIDVPLPAGIGPDIRVLEFDSRGNAWIGSINGVARIDVLDGSGVVYNSVNSGLVSDFIYSIHYDEFTGKIYVATDKGISVIGSTIGPPTSEALEVTAFPNPFVIEDSGDELEFNYNQSGIIRIYSLAGELINEFPVGRRWNGTNSKNELVVSGVYLFVLTSDNGAVGRGKILLIRK